LYWATYRPMHTSYRSNAQWFKPDRNDKARAYDAYKLAQAQYELHRSEHRKELDGAGSREGVQNLNIVLRNGTEGIAGCAAGF